MLLCACSGARGLTQTDDRSRLSSLVRHDSIMVHDSVEVRIRADTVCIERWHTRWRERETVRTDTVTQTVTRTETVKVRYVPTFYKYSTALGIMAVLIGVAGPVIKRILYHRFNQPARTCLPAIRAKKTFLNKYFL